MIECIEGLSGVLSVPIHIRCGGEVAEAKAFRLTDYLAGVRALEIDPDLVAETEVDGIEDVGPAGNGERIIVSPTRVDRAGADPPWSGVPEPPPPDTFPPDT